MSGGRQNVFVALTVLGALVALGWMIIKFGGTLGGLAAGGGHPINLVLPRVDGLSEGARVVYRGRSVGRVSGISLSEERTAFDVGLLINNEQVPANVIGVVRATNPISGGAIIELDLEGDAAQGSLFEVAVIPGISEGGGLLPPEVPKLAGDLSALLAEVRQERLVPLLVKQVESLGELITSVNAIAGDDELIGELRQAITSAQHATEVATTAAEEYQRLGTGLNDLQVEARVVLEDIKAISASARSTTATANDAVAKAQDDLTLVTDSVLARLDRVDRLLVTGEGVAAKLNNGEGTLALMLNDPSVYRILEDDLRILGELLKGARRLIEQFEEEGVNVSIF